jgi:diguanylate cyclase (GGDEF)-like protein
MDSLATELGDAVGRIREESRRSRVLGDLGSSIDLDDVLRRVADAAASVEGADAALVRSVDGNGLPVVASAGLPTEEAERHVAAGPPDGGPARAVSFSFLNDESELGDDAIRTGIAVPLATDETLLGFVAAYSRSPRPFGEDAIGDLQIVADRAAPAVDNARRYRKARQEADTDALTGLYNQRTFHETLAREAARAGRYGRKLSLLLLDVDDFKNVNDRIGHLAGDAVLAELAELVREHVRSADVACRIGGDELGVILPESTRADAHGLFARILATLQRRPPAEAGGLSLSGGIAELRPDDDGLLLFQRADEALYRAKAGGKGIAHDENGRVTTGADDQGLPRRGGLRPIAPEGAGTGNPPPG